MIQKLQVIYSSSFNPYYNLALEEFLVNQPSEEIMTLYLWQNAHTVVIGRNQNAWKECQVNALEDDQGHLARRLSGGGAVYHDLGNLNFTFVTNTKDYDVTRQSNIILRALAYEGIKGEQSGRNDLLIDGRKFSGNAYYKTSTNCYHHGTLLVDVDIDNMGKYLNVSQDKLKGNGVASVRSRVMNLKEVIPNLTIDKLKQHLVNALEEEYGYQSTLIELSNEEVKKINILKERFQSKEWKFNRNINTNFEVTHRFNWGEIQLMMEIDTDVIRDCAVYSDAIDVTIMPRIEEALLEQKFHRHVIREALSDIVDDTNKDIINDIQQLLEASLP